MNNKELMRKLNTTKLMRRMAKLRKKQEKLKEDQPQYKPRCAKLLSDIEKTISEGPCEYTQGLTMLSCARELAEAGNHADLRRLLTGCRNACPRRATSNMAGKFHACGSTE